MASLVRQEQRSAPILLVGLPRSGTTWVGKIFDSHPSTLYLHEPDSAVPIEEIPLVVPEDGATIAPEQLEAIVARTLSVRLTRVAGSLPRFPKDYRNPVVDWLHRRLAAVLKMHSRAFPEAELPDMLRKHGNRPVRLAWKSVLSVGRIGLIARLMPEIRVIHILRHPCGWMTSYDRGYKERWFTSQRNDWRLLRLLEATPLARRQNLTLESFRSMSDIERDTWIWLLWNESGAAAAKGLPNVSSVLYEKLCAAPLKVSRQMFDFVDLDWNRQTEMFVERSVSAHRDSYYGVYRNPSISASKWRNRFSPEQVRLVESIMSRGSVGKLFLE
jgi:hypothetical protein